MDNAEQHLWNSIQKIIENEEISIALSTQINEHIRRSKYNNGISLFSSVGYQIQIFDDSLFIFSIFI